MAIARKALFRTAVDMLPAMFAVCFWASTALAACHSKTKIHLVRADDRSRSGDRGMYYHHQPERLQSRASSIFGSSSQPSAAAAGFPYRFVFPANHPALNGPVYSEYLQSQQPNQQQPESLFSSEDLYTAPATTKQHPLANHKHLRQQYPQHQQLSYDFFGGGGGKHQPYHLVKQPKHYQSYELAIPGPTANNFHNHHFTHQSSPYTSSFQQHQQQQQQQQQQPLAQPIMLLIPSSGQPGAPYQTLVLVPSSASSVAPPPLSAPPQNSLFTAFPQPPPMQQLQAASPQYLQPGGFVTHPRGAPMQVAAGYANAISKFPGTAQLFHRSHDPQHQQTHHKLHQHQRQHQRQHQHQPQRSPPPPSTEQQQQQHQQQQQQQQQQQPQQLKSPITSYQSSGSVHVSHATSVGGPTIQQPLEDKVSVSTGASSETSGDDRVDGSAETKSDEKKQPTLEFGDRTSTKAPPKRIVVT